MTVYFMPPGPALPARRPPIPSVVLGMVVFVMTEVMFFCALISAYTVIKSHVFGTWSPPGDVKLPVAATAFNSLVLMGSGALMVLATKAYTKDRGSSRARMLLSQSILLGAFFVIFQGYEWVRLISYGLSMTSGIFGATFFLLIGSHGLHALIAVLAMALAYHKLTKGTLTADGLRALAIFWMFVVGVWPVLYGLVYFG